MDGLSVHRFLEIPENRTLENLADRVEGEIISLGFTRIKDLENCENDGNQTISRTYASGEIMSVIEANYSSPKLNLEYGRENPHMIQCHGHLIVIFPDNAPMDELDKRLKRYYLG